MNLPEYTYLYGLTPKEVGYLTQMPYELALRHKIEKAKALLECLLENGYETSDHYRVNTVNKAIKFNKKLLEELT